MRPVHIDWIIALWALFCLPWLEYLWANPSSLEWGKQAIYCSCTRIIDSSVCGASTTFTRLAPTREWENQITVVPCDWVNPGLEERIYAPVYSILGDHSMAILGSIVDGERERTWSSGASMPQHGLCVGRRTTGGGCSINACAEESWLLLNSLDDCRGGGAHGCNYCRQRTGEKVDV